MRDALEAGELPMTHWDVSLRDWLEKAGTAEKIGASYVYPAVGSFKGHESHCCPSVGVRNPLWGERWCQQGGGGALGQARRRQFRQPEQR